MFPSSKFQNIMSDITSESRVSLQLSLFKDLPSCCLRKYRSRGSEKVKIVIDIKYRLPCKQNGLTEIECVIISISYFV